MTAHPSNQTPTQALPKQQAERQRPRAVEGGNASSALFGLAAPTDLPTAILNLQTLSGNHAVADLLNSSERADENERPDPVQSILNSGRGRPLEPTVRAFMESRFGFDFGRVRIHDYPQAAESARDVNALAYTVDQDVVFDSGLYAPGTRAGQRLLGHELTHVVQQSRAGGSTAALLPGSAQEQSAEHAAASLSEGAGAVAVAGASAVGVARAPRPSPDKSNKRRTLSELKEKARASAEGEFELEDYYQKMPEKALQQAAKKNPTAQYVWQRRMQTTDPKAPVRLGEPPPPNTELATLQHRHGPFRGAPPNLWGKLKDDISADRKVTGIRRQYVLKKEAPKPQSVSTPPEGMAEPAKTPLIEPGSEVVGGTVGAARSNIPQLGNEAIIGRSPHAGGKFDPTSKFPPATNPKILPQTHSHAEEQIANIIHRKLANVPRSLLQGRRIWMLIEQQPCSTCGQGLGSKQAELSGVLRKLSKEYPEIIFEVKNLESSQIYRIQDGVDLEATTLGTKPAPGGLEEGPPTQKTTKATAPPRSSEAAKQQAAQQRPAPEQSLVEKPPAEKPPTPETTKVSKPTQSSEAAGVEPAARSQVVEKPPTAQPTETTTPISEPPAAKPVEVPPSAGGSPKPLARGLAKSILPGAAGFAAPLLLGFIHQKAVQRRIEKQREQEGYAPYGPSGEGLFYDLISWFIDPTAGADIPLDARLDMAKLRAHIRTLTTSKKPGETITAGWQVGSPPLISGSISVTTYDVTYKKSADGKWAVVDKGDYPGEPPDLNYILDEKVSDSEVELYLHLRPAGSMMA